MSIASPFDDDLTALPRRAMIGDLEVWSLSDGHFFPTPAYFGPEVADGPRADLFTSGGELHDLPLGCFLLRGASGRVVLVDAGLGCDGEAETAGWEQYFTMAWGDLPAQIAATGVTPNEVTDVVVTHFHADHFGWLLDRDGAETFPGARVWAGHRDLEYFRDVAQGGLRLTEPMRSLFERLAREHRLELVEDADVCEGISIHDAPGHTPGHVVVVAESRGQTLWMLGDAMTIPHQLGEPTWHSCGDLDPDLAQQTRDGLWVELEKPDTWGVGSHFPRLIPGSVLAAEGRTWATATPDQPIAVRHV